MDGFAEEVAVEHAREEWRSWLDLQGHHLLQAIWDAQEPKEGLEFTASFRAIFETDFWDLLASLNPSPAISAEACRGQGEVACSAVKVEREEDGGGSGLNDQPMKGMSVVQVGSDCS